MRKFNVFITIHKKIMNQKYKPNFIIFLLLINRKNSNNKNLRILE